MSFVHVVRRFGVNRMTIIQEGLLLFHFLIIADLSNLFNILWLYSSGVAIMILLGVICPVQSKHVNILGIPARNPKHAFDNVLRQQSDDQR